VRPIVHGALVVVLCVAASANPGAGTHDVAQTPPPVATPTANAGTEQDVKELSALRQRLVDAFNKGDIDTLLGSVSPTVVVIWQNGEVNQGPDAVRQFYTRMMKGADSVVTNVAFPPEVEGRRFYGNTAVSYGTLNDRFTLRDGRELPLNSRWSSTLEKDAAGHWVLTSFHASANIFDNPVGALVARRVGMWAGGGGLLLGFIAGAVIARRRAPKAR
jgi:ketosteroid isomerase-like protein